MVNFLLFVFYTNTKNSVSAYIFVDLEVANKRPILIFTTTHLLYYPLRSMRKQEFLVPLIIVLRALRDISDQELYDRFIQNYNHY